MVMKPDRSSTRAYLACKFYFMETTIQLDDYLLAQAKQYAEQGRRSLSQVIAEALREKLASAPIPPI